MHTIVVKKPQGLRRLRSVWTRLLLWWPLCVACSHQAIVPESKNVKLQREPVAKDCREIGPVQGSVSTAQGKIEDAIEDMKMDAARKGANVVHVEMTSAIGTSISGTAYQCP